MIYDKSRNAVLSGSPLWLPAEALLACIEVKSNLTRAELVNTFKGTKLVTNLRPFGERFLIGNVGPKQAITPLTPSGKQRKRILQSRCFRTLFAYDSDLSTQKWLRNEWARVESAAAECSCPVTAIDRILVIGRGLITPGAKAGTENSAFASVFHQWFIHLANFLEQENSRRPPLDWHKYTKKKIPGWIDLP